MNSHRRLVLAAGLIALAPALATGPAAGEDDPTAPYLWDRRPVIVFADSDRDPRFRRQVASLDARAADLEERDVVILLDTAPGPSRFETTPLRKKYRPDGFTVIVVGKDGEVKLRRPGFVDADELIRLIDRMPLRLQETGRRG